MPIGASVKTPARARERLIGLIMLAAALIYLLHFIPRGWIPHDEGMLGQSAERVLRGEVPHIEFEDPYTGGLSWLYAGVFRLFGVDLLNIRWVLFVVASASMALVYSIERRYFAPFSAAITVWLALAWSFPNYFAGLPSWWLLLCALVCIWAVLRYIETDCLWYLAAAGLASGTAIAIKQTGVYIFIAVLLFLAYEERQQASRPSSLGATIDHLVRWAIGIAALLAAAILLWPRLMAAEGLYLFCPVAACTIAALVGDRSAHSRAHERSLLTRVLIVSAAAGAPMIAVLAPYLLHGNLREFMYGAFVLPRKRLIYASIPMPAARVMMTGIPLIGLVAPVPRSMFGTRSRPLEVFAWIVALASPVLALWNIAVYQLIWQSTRSLVALLPVLICFHLATGRIENDKQRRILFIMASVLAWASLNQFPYAHAIYFCYVVPLAVLAGGALGDATGSLRPAILRPWIVMVLLFAVLGPHRAYTQTLGVFHAPRQFDTPLNLARAHLNVERSNAAMYRRVVALINEHAGRQQVLAGPDCPEIYFLTGANNSSRQLFDFFDDSDATASWAAASRSSGVIVINQLPEFSPKLAPEVMERLRTTFPNSEIVGKFDVRWR